MSVLASPNRTAQSVLVVLLIMSLIVSPALAASDSQVPAADTVTITMLHYNDFHGNLQPAGSNPGIARMAKVINDVRAAVGAENVVLLDAGDTMQGSLLSNLFRGRPTIDLMNALGTRVATLGNHEFDWGQQVLRDRIAEAAYPFVTANIVVNDTGNCATAGWTTPEWAQPWTTVPVGAAGNEATLAVIGVTSQETPYITIAAATEGLCFKDPANSILHYYDDMEAAGVDAIIVLSHLGYTDGGYGYGFTVYGDQTLARRLAAAGKKPALIIGGHSHTDLSAATIVEGIPVVQAHYAGRKVGRADLVINKATGTVGVTWTRLTVSPTGAEDPVIKARVDSWANDPWYQGEINRVIGYTAVDLVRNYNGDSTMGAFVNDAIYNDLNTDDTPANDVDMVFNNPGGLRNDILTGGTVPYTLTHGMLFNVLPFGNQTVVGDMTGAQILELLNQSATLFKGAIQVSGMRYIFYNYTDNKPGPQPWAWGAYNVQVKNRVTGHWEPLDVNRTYRIATNEFLAPAGQDGFLAFKYLKNNTYWGDMLDGVERWVSRTYTWDNPYNGQLDGRIRRNGTATSGYIVPVTILHNNDSHGNLAKGVYVGFTQLASLIRQEMAHNPERTLLLNAGDQIQGDGMMYYFKTAPMGYGADGTPLPPELTLHPMIAVQDAMNYTAWTVGNHEFNFGKDVFTAVLRQSRAPVLQANVRDDGRYGLATVPVRPHTIVTLPAPSFHKTIKVAILGIGNHRVPNYELPSNIVGLTFTNPIMAAQSRAPALKSQNDIVVALTHIGFTTNPASIEVDTNVDTALAAQTNGIDVIVGGHSHTDPSRKTSASGTYEYLPAFVGSPNGTPVLINHAYRYNTYLGQIVIGLLPGPAGKWQVVSRAGRYHAVTMSTPEDPAIKALVDPYVAVFSAYNNMAIGQTAVPLDALDAYTRETNAANLQADASVWEPAQHGISVDFHLSGAMANRRVGAGATPETPVTLKVSDMFTLMPYENSLVVMRMNGPQIKTILERAYRNYYYYKYVPGAGGYSYYTTCMLDINAGGQITYNDTYPELPNGNNVVSLVVNGESVDFTDTSRYYLVSTVNYLAAGSCNFNDGGVTLWPLNQIEHDTQYYVRDAVINYIKAQPGPISPAIEGRLVFLGGGTVAAQAATPEPGWALEWVPPLQTAVPADMPDEDTLNVDLTWTVTEW